MYSCLIRVGPEDGILSHVSVIPSLVNLVIKINSPSYLVILISEECTDLDLKKIRAIEISTGQELDPPLVKRIVIVGSGKQLVMLWESRMNMVG